MPGSQDRTEAHVIAATATTRYDSADLHSVSDANHAVTPDPDLPAGSGACAYRRPAERHS
jgi:hypothetical protein